MNTNTMPLNGFAAILSSFNTLFDILPADETSDALFDSFVEVMSNQLPNKHYAYYQLDSDPMHYVMIFDTAEERDDYVAKTWGCDPITYSKFIRAANEEEFNLNKYTVKDEKVLFDLAFNEGELPD